MRGTLWRAGHLICFHAGWLACVLGAAAGRPLLGPAVVVAWVSVHLILTEERRSEAGFIAAAAAFGYAADSVLVMAGLLVFPASAALGWPSTVWMVALWANLAAAFSSLLSWLRGRYLLAAAAGAAAGPLAYGAGARAGALILAEPYGATLLWIAAEWAVSLAALALASEKIQAGRWAGEGEAARTGGDSA